MVAGLNTQIRIWRMDDIADDDVGGARVSGTVAYDYVKARIEANPAEQLLLQQGLETERGQAAGIGLGGNFRGERRG